MSSVQPYNRPPIVGATFEVRFSSTFDAREIERARDRFKRNYPSIEEQKSVEVTVLPDRIATKATLSGYKMTAGNGVDIIILQSNLIATSRNAPYEGWERLIETTKDNVEQLVKIVGRREIIRLGTRFINRFDIPLAKIEGRDISEFLKLGIAIPPEVSTRIGPYSLAVNFVEQHTGVKVLAQSAVAEPVLLDHASFVLDIDAFLDADLSKHKDAIWECASTLRQVKNSVFENSITDDMRELFK